MGNLMSRMWAAGLLMLGVASAGMAEPLTGIEVAQRINARDEGSTTSSRIFSRR